MSLNPTPGNDIIEVGSSRLSTPWRAWFDALYQYVAKRPNASFYDTSIQGNAGLSQVNLIKMSTTEFATNISIDDTRTKITVAMDGLYSIDIALQMSNSNVADQDAIAWVRKNGTDITYSAMYLSIPAKHGGVDGHALLSWNYLNSLKANDYVQFCWYSTSSNVSLTTYDSASTPTPYPAAASVDVNIVRIN